ncbi:YdcF family protein [Undibacter mobilis]|nr:YdcF family protein [Undibacter mobilis]
MSKTVTVLLQPSNLILLIGVVGLALMLMRWRRAGIRLVVASVILLFIAGLLPLGAYMTHVLERRFPLWEQSGGPARGAPTGIVVLGGAVSPLLSQQTGLTAVNGDAGRVLALAHLARAFPGARIIYSGGDGSLLGNKPREADYIGPLLDDFGLARARVELEPASRNTVENAVFSRQMAQPKPGERWLLVTSAQHMPRAVGAFRAAGFPVEAYPVAYQVERQLRLRPGFTVGHNLARLDRATNEWVGLIAYWATGRSSALFPAP